MDWYTNTYSIADEEYKKAFEGIYIIGVDNKLYKLVKDGFVECTVKEIIERNHEGTTI
jgi:hypothetical protein